MPQEEVLFELRSAAINESDCVQQIDASHKLEFVRSMGADHAIDYALVDFTETAERYDLIIDVRAIGRCLTSSDPYGRMESIR